MNGNTTTRQLGADWRECCKRHNKLRELRLCDESRSFKIVDEIHEAVINKDVRRLNQVRSFSGELNERNFHDILLCLLKVDEAYSAINLRKFDMFNQRLKIKYRQDNEGNILGLSHYGLEVEGLSNGQPSLIPNDLVLLRDPKTDTYEKLIIDSISGDVILFPNHFFKDKQAFLEKSLDISFISSGLTYDYYDKAMERARDNPDVKHRIFEQCSPFHSREEPKIKIETSLNEELDSRLDALNEPQRQAVYGILEAKCWPKPYILFGPPGTGKTHTLVEAIAQIYARNGKAKILFCANSNTCADQTVEKLKKIGLIANFDIQRLSARDRTESINSSRILVTTNMKSASLMGSFEYDFVFIDEAGHAHEPETLLPICSLKHDGCLVLAGDPKQLGPVVQCAQAEEYGLGKSMFERIFRFKAYRRHHETGYDKKYITKLLFCYRCDSRILAISNELFYDNELQCLNGTPKSLLKMMNLSGPVQFCHVRGAEFQPKYSTSWRNQEEALLIVDMIIRQYKMGIEPDQIGVISPYKSQAKLISLKLADKLREGLLNLLEERFKQRKLVKKKIVKENGNSVGLENGVSHEDPVEGLITNLNGLELSGGGDEVNVNKKDEVEYEWVWETVRRDDKWLCKIDTVDAFQGNEREIIIISTVRTATSGRRTGFIDESRRFNVALSRAKWLLVVFGHKDVLESHTNWYKFTSSAERNDVDRWPRQSVFDQAFQQFPLFRESY